MSGAYYRTNRRHFWQSHILTLGCPKNSSLSPPWENPGNGPSFGFSLNLGWVDLDVPPSARAVGNYCNSQSALGTQQIWVNPTQVSDHQSRPVVVWDGVTDVNWSFFTGLSFLLNLSLCRAPLRWKQAFVALLQISAQTFLCVTSLIYYLMRVSDTHNMLYKE